MDSIQWREDARLVALVDMVLTCMALVLVILFALLAAAFTAVAIDRSEIINRLSQIKIWVGESVTMQPVVEIENDWVIIAWFMWILFAIAAIFTFTQLWAAIKLLNATDVGRKFHEALDKAATWRDVTVVFLIFQVCGLFFAGNKAGCISFFIIGIVVKGISLLVVHKFMSEVNCRLTKSPFPGPTVVTEKNHLQLKA